jgi:ATP-dependent helicase/nuclease subunit A
VSQLELEFAPPATGAIGVPPPDQAARDRIRTETAATLFVEAGAGAGKTSALVGRVVTLVDEGVPIESIAAITFTEKAAGELRHRVREELSAEPVSDVRRAALDQLDGAPIGTLHAFARRILFEFPVEANLPPGFTVLDELESQLALAERWDDLLDDLLDDPDHEIAPGLRAAGFVELCEWERFQVMRGLLRVVQDFQANWDLVEAWVDTTVPPRPAVGARDLADRAAAIGCTPTPPGDRQEAVLQRLCEAAGDLARAEDVGATLAGLTAVRAAVAPRFGDRRKWSALGVDALERLRAEQTELAGAVDARLATWREYRRLVVGAVAARFVLDGAHQRAAAGTLEFHDLLVLARRLLTHHDGARRLLHDRYQRVLLDEFQDTDPIQLDLAVRLTAVPDDTPAAGRPLRPLPGRLFVVGDPKQSIYRFRRADIATYLRAGEQLEAERVVLSANFRSSAAVIDWVNGVFSEVISPQPDVQPAFVPLDTCREGPRDHGTVTVLGVEPHDDSAGDVTAQVLREREAAEVANAVATALRAGWPVGDGDGGLRPCRADDIAVLLPARTSLPMLETALSRLAVPYRAENASVVYVAPEIRHLLLTLRAVADPTDELALVAALRSPLYGCSDVELYEWRTAGGRWSPLAGPPHDGLAAHPVAAALAHVGSLARRIGGAGPAELLDAIVDERRVLETALAGPDARDVWRRVRFVIDQARAWTDAGGRGIRRYLRWAAFQAGEGRASDTILPERDHDAVRIMTVHAAKGLEFPITVLAGLTTQMQRRTAMSVVWLRPHGAGRGTAADVGPGWTLADRHSELFEQFQPLDEQMGDAERRRLLYVACTRAVDHLVVSLHRKPEAVTDGTAKATSATVLAAAGAHGHGARVLDRLADALPRATTAASELPWADAGEWAAARTRAIRQASTRSALSATRLAAMLAAAPPTGADAPSAESDAGLAKDPVDLDLPPWQRGRYGTAIGRAVHAVLQDADLATGADIDGLALVQCAAEGIFGFEARVAELSRSALAAPIVQQAAAGAEHWRELFVVAELGAAVLEGYIDLLVRSPDGLVIVDYKTDQWRPGADREARVARYRHQLAAYGVALGRLLAEPVVGGVLVRCRPDGPAEEITVDGWADALAVVEHTPLLGLTSVGTAAQDGPDLARFAQGPGERAHAPSDAGEQPP